MPNSKIPRTVTDTNQLRSMASRRGIKLETTSKAHTSASLVQTAVSSVIASLPGQEHKHQSEAIGKPVIEIPVEDADKPSIDLRRKPRGLIRWFKYLPGRVRNYFLILRPPPTPDEIEKREYEKQERYRDRLAVRECRKYARLISEKLAQLGERELIGNNTENRPRKVKKVKFDMYTRDQLFTKLILRIDTNPRHLPSYVRLSDLGRKEFYSDEMLPTLGHYLVFISNEAGVFAVVYRAGLDGLPEFVTAEEIWRKVPDNKPPLTFPVGYGDNSMRKDIDLDDCPHLLVAGSTKKGKSNFINQVIAFWLRRGLTPEDFQLVLFDLKRGMEFCWYEGLPHLYHDEPDVVEFERQKAANAADDKETYNPAYIETGIIEDLSGVMPAMRRLRKMMDKRLGHIKAAKHKDFNAYNNAQHSRKKHMPAMVVIFDEWARVRLSLGTEPEVLLAEMTNLARAAGMYFIVGTQNPNSAVISPLIAVNFSTRIIFKCSVGGSMAALGDQSAVGLERAGRCILQDGGDEFKLQTPFISDGLLRAVVYKAITGKDKKFSNAIDLEEILQYSLDNLDGMLDIAKLFMIYREKTVRRNWLISALSEAEKSKETYVLSGTPYRVSPRGNHTARQLARVEE
jgi:hypothetical protein